MAKQTNSTLTSYLQSYAFIIHTCSLAQRSTERVNQ